ncbi:MAG: DUF805 domain-containing protein [Parvibaculaceae bacterium]
MEMSLFTSFEGRIPRSKFWLGIVIILVVQAVLFAVIGALAGGDINGGEPNPALLAVAGIVALLLLWPSLAIYAKRWHDRDKSAWWILIGLVPLIGGIWVFVECGCLRGTDGPNRFGPDPLA